MSAEHFRILPGLPTEGPFAEPFPASGKGAHREGFVVEFFDGSGGSWVGNFQSGLSSCEKVFDTFGNDRIIVISGGDGYIVDPENRKAVAEFGGQIEWCFELRDPARFVYANGLWFEARDRSGVIWRSKRISWDGMSELVHEGGTVRGLAWSPYENLQHFELNLADGTFSGGSYPNEKG